MIAIACIRRAAAELRNEGVEITIAALAQKTTRTHKEISLYVNGVAGLKDEINLQVDRSHFPAYQQAAEKIHARGDLVTFKTLARMLGKKRSAVGQEFLRHPDWVAVLGLKTYGEAAKEKRRRNYIEAIRELWRRNERVSCCAIARLCGKDRTRVSHDLNTVFNLAELKAAALAQPEMPLQAAE